MRGGAIWSKAHMPHHTEKTYKIKFYKTRNINKTTNRSKKNTDEALLHVHKESIDRLWKD